MDTKIVLASLVMGLLTACEPTRTQEYYLSHSDELAADLAECKEQSKNTFNCNEASKAAFIMSAKTKKME